jgi:hypothetical protein
MVTSCFLRLTTLQKAAIIEYKLPIGLMGLVLVHPSTLIRFS